MGKAGRGGGLMNKKDLARSKVSRAIRAGRLTRPNHCELCGREAWIVGHHEDYDKPLVVMWLCQVCHSLQHANDLHTTVRRKRRAPISRKRNGEMTTTEAAGHCGYKVGYFYRIKDRLRHRKEGGVLYFAVADLDAFIAGRSTTHIPAKGAA